MPVTSLTAPRPARESLGYEGDPVTYEAPTEKHGESPCSSSVTWCTAPHPTIPGTGTAPQQYIPAEQEEPGARAEVQAHPTLLH